MSYELDWQSIMGRIIAATTNRNWDFSPPLCAPGIDLRESIINFPRLFGSMVDLDFSNIANASVQGFATALMRGVFADGTSFHECNLHRVECSSLRNARLSNSFAEVVNSDVRGVTVHSTDLQSHDLGLADDDLRTMGIGVVPLHFIWTTLTNTDDRRAGVQGESLDLKVPAVEWKAFYERARKFLRRDPFMQELISKVLIRIPATEKAQLGAAQRRRRSR
jgi:hypothetical protein